MNVIKETNNSYDPYFIIIKSIISLGLLVSLFFSVPIQTYAFKENDGKEIFLNHCSGCHINGGNIIRRNKTLKIKDLKRNGINSEEAIAKIALEGIGSMSGYKDVLEENEDQIVAIWIWDQAQNAWVHG